MTNRTLNWVQPKAFRREFELRAAEGLFALLRWHGYFSATASAISADGSWTFSKAEVFQSGVLIRTPDSDRDIGVLKRTWTGAGNLELGSEVTIQWKRAGGNLFYPEWGFIGENHEVLHFKSKPGFWKHGVEMKVKQDMREIAMLASLGMFLIILKQDENAAS
jgi:hypothetical protein